MEVTRTTAIREVANYLGCEVVVATAAVVAAVAAVPGEARHTVRAVDAEMVQTGRGPGDYPRAWLQQ